jgi:hypothetical protein
MSATQSGPGVGHQLSPWLFVFDRQPRAPLLEKKKGLATSGGGAEVCATTGLR